MRTNQTKRTKDKLKFVVTLTSYGSRVEKTAPHAIFSLLNQTIVPDRIILWLAHGTPIPTILKTFSEAGLEIRFCDDLKSYNKLIPALSEFPNDVLITVDDDVFYPQNWLEQLKNSHQADPSKIHVHRAHEIGVDGEGNLLPYKDWMFCIQSTDNEEKIFPTGVGGILYPQQFLVFQKFLLDQPSKT